MQQVKDPLIRKEFPLESDHSYLILGWSKYVKVGTYDCNSESTSENDICQDDAYPQWRIFCPLTNSTHLAFDATRKTADTKPEDILMWLIRKLNKIAHDCYGKSWPIRDAIKYLFIFN